MKYITAVIVILFSFGTIKVTAQDTTRTLSPGAHNDKPSFGGLENGAISISEHLEDSLAFTDPWMNERFRIASFNLALKCNGNTVKYLENKSGNKLTPEMKQAVQQLHSNCTINFEGIKSLSLQKDAKGKYTESKIAPFKLTLK
jgi:hypothetical protein